MNAAHRDGADARLEVEGLFQRFKGRETQIRMIPPAEAAAIALEQLAAPGPDTPEFTALLDEFPDAPSRGNLKVILWRLAAHLRAEGKNANVADKSAKNAPIDHDGVVVALSKQLAELHVHVLNDSWDIVCWADHLPPDQPMCWSDGCDRYPVVKSEAHGGYLCAQHASSEPVRNPPGASQ